jgi:hypothetical protein
MHLLHAIQQASPSAHRMLRILIADLRDTQKSWLFTRFLSFLFDSWPLKMGPICCPETSVRNYQYSLRNNPKECSSYFNCSVCHLWNINTASPYYYPLYKQRVDRSNYRSNSMPVFTDSVEGVVHKFICLRQVIAGGMYCLLEAVFSAF